MKHTGTALADALAQQEIALPDGPGSLPWF